MAENGSARNNSKVTSQRTAIRNKTGTDKIGSQQRPKKNILNKLETLSWKMHQNYSAKILETNFWKIKWRKDFFTKETQSVEKPKRRPSKYAKRFSKTKTFLEEVKGVSFDQMNFILKKVTQADLSVSLLHNYWKSTGPENNPRSNHLDSETSFLSRKPQKTKKMWKQSKNLKFWEKLVALLLLLWTNRQVMM